MSFSDPKLTNPNPEDIVEEQIQNAFCSPKAETVERSKDLGALFEGDDLPY